MSECQDLLVRSPLQLDFHSVTVVEEKYQREQQKAEIEKASGMDIFDLHAFEAGIFCTVFSEFPSKYTTLGTFDQAKVRSKGKGIDTPYHDEHFGFNSPSVAPKFWGRADTVVHCVVVRLWYQGAPVTMRPTAALPRSAPSKGAATECCGH